MRHPPAVVAPGVCYGRLDIGLRGDATETVREIVSAIAGAGAVQVWASPASRCLVVAKAVARAIGADLLVDPRLQELDFGTLGGDRVGQHSTRVARCLGRRSNRFCTARG